MTRVTGMTGEDGPRPGARQGGRAAHRPDGPAP